MKKLFVLLAIFSLVSIKAFATPITHADGTVDVTATVVHTDLSVVDPDDVDLGEFTRGASETFSSPYVLTWNITGTPNWDVDCVLASVTPNTGNTCTLYYNPAVGSSTAVTLSNAAPGTGSYSINVTGIDVPLNETLAGKSWTFDVDFDYAP